MKSGFDEVSGLLRKAENDLRIVEIGLDHGAPLDMVGFHLQQAAEKLLKAVLSYRRVPCPFTHDLQELMKQAVAEFSELAEFETWMPDLTPYAVRTRYDSTFYPGRDEVLAAWETVKKLRAVVHARLPPEALP